MRLARGSLRQDWPGEVARGSRPRQPRPASVALRTQPHLPARSGEAGCTHLGELDSRVPSRSLTTFMSRRSEVHSHSVEPATCVRGTFFPTGAPGWKVVEGTPSRSSHLSMTITRAWQHHRMFTD